MADAYCRPSQCGGGVMILLNDQKQVKFSRIDSINTLLEGQFEVCAALINESYCKYIVMNIYRPLYNNNLDNFIESLDRAMDILCN